MSKIIKSWKGMSERMSSYDGSFRYEQNGEYECSEVEVCKKGFHAYSMPIRVFRIYPPGNGRYFEVQQSGMIDEKDDEIASSKLKIGKEIGIEGIIEAQIEWAQEAERKDRNWHLEGLIPNEGKATIVEDCDAITVGSYGVAYAGRRGAATAGFCGVAIVKGSGGATAGNCGVTITEDYGAAATKNYGMAKTGKYGAAVALAQGKAIAGDNGVALTMSRGKAIAGSSGTAVSGDYGVAEVGDYGTANTGKCGKSKAGEFGVAVTECYGTATAGYHGVAISQGNASVGEDGIAYTRGEKGKAKGKKGAILVIVEEEESEVKNWKAAMVDGVKIKEDTWYELVDGEFVEVIEGENR